MFAIDETVILKIVLRGDQLSARILPELDPNWFKRNVGNEKLLVEIKKYYDEYQKFPNSLELRQIFAKDDGTVTGAINAVNQIDADQLQTEYIITGVEKFIRDKKIRDAALDLVNSIEGATDGSGIARKIEEAQTFSLQNSKALDLKRDLEKFYDESHSDERFVKSGVKTLDNLLRGGFGEGTVTFFLAPTNVGKTMIMSSLSASMVNNNYKVLYFAFEDGRISIMQRIYQNLLNLTYQDFACISKARFLTMAGDKLDKINETIKVEEFPGGTKSAASIRSYIKDLERSDGFKPDIVFLDYVGCMIPNNQDKSANRATTLETTVEDVKSIAMEMKIPFVTAAQVRRDALNSDNLELNDTGSSIGMIFKADAVVGATQNEEQNQNNVMVMKVLKTRAGGKFASGMVGTDIDKQRVYDIDPDVKSIADLNEKKTQEIQEKFFDLG